MRADLLGQALSYAQRGWPVFPLHTPSDGGCSCTRSDCKSMGKHPRTKKGLSDATMDKVQIRTWWAQWPDANIGILTGSASGLLVIDIDNKGGKCGSDNFAAIAAQSDGVPTTLTAITGSGEHLLLKHPGVIIKNSASALAAGIDVRGEGGYIVAPPSLHANGKRYTWQDPSHEPAEVPNWLLARLTSKKGTTKMQETEQTPFTEAETVHEGNRNDTLYKLGCALRGQQGMERDEVAALLLEYNTAKCDPPLDEPEVLTIVDSVCQHAAEFATNKSGKRLENNPLYWFPFNTRDWFADQNLAMMDDAQTGRYIRLKAFAWANGGFLPADSNKLWKLAKAKTKKAFERDSELVLAEYVEVYVGGERKLKNPAMAARYTDTLEAWMKKKDAGDASYAARLAAREESKMAALPQIQ